jgi:hypothetical protein
MTSQARREKKQSYNMPRRPSRLRLFKKSGAIPHPIGKHPPLTQGAKPQWKERGRSVMQRRKVGQGLIHPIAPAPAQIRHQAPDIPRLDPACYHVGEKAAGLLHLHPALPFFDVIRRVAAQK